MSEYATRDALKRRENKEIAFSRVSTMAGDTSWMCPICGLYFRTRAAVRYHMKQHHAQFEMSRVNFSQLPRVCPVCYQVTFVGDIKEQIKKLTAF